MWGRGRNWDAFRESRHVVWEHNRHGSLGVGVDVDTRPGPGVLGSLREVLEVNLDLVPLQEDRQQTLGLRLGLWWHFFLFSET